MVTELFFRHAANVSSSQVHHVQEFIVDSIAPHETIPVVKRFIDFNFSVMLDTDHGFDVSNIIHIGAFSSFINAGCNIKATNTNDIF